MSKLRKVRVVADVDTWGDYFQYNNNWKDGIRRINGEFVTLEPGGGASGGYVAIHPSEGAVWLPAEWIDRQGRAF